MKRAALLLDLARLTAEITSEILAYIGLTDAATITCAIALALDALLLLRITWPHDEEETDDSDNDQDDNDQDDNDADDNED